MTTRCTSSWPWPTRAFRISSSSSAKRWATSSSRNPSSHELGQLAERLPAMADCRLLLRRDFAKGEPERRIEEDGVVAEVVRTARLVGDPSLHRLRRFEEHVRPAHENEGTGEPGGAPVVFHAAQPFQDQTIAIG